MARGKTHQSSKVDFRFDGQNYTLVDTPGHSIFIRSMIEGVYAVKIAGLIIPMINNEFESAFKSTLKEHLLIARASGVEKIVLLANKMDLIGWDREEFTKKTDIVKDFLQKVGFNASDIITVPVSAYLGVGLVDKTGLPEWHGGPSFMEAVQIHQSNLTGMQQPQQRQQTFRGKSFIIDTRVLNCEQIITLGFQAVLHIEGGEHTAELVGIKNGESKFIKNGDKCFTIWKIEQTINVSNDKILIRKGDNTIGLGKIIKIVEIK